MCPASDAARMSGRGPVWEFEGSGPHHWNALEALPVRLVLLAPPHRRCAIPVLRPPHPVDSLRPVNRSSGHGRSSIDPTLGKQRPSDPSILVCQRHNHQHRRLAGQHPAEPRTGRHAHRTTPLAAMISKRRSVRSPIREVRPRRSFPPVDRCTGVRPIQAAKSRPERKVSVGGASASIAVAIKGPIPGTVMRRRAPSSALALAVIWRSSSAISAWR